MLLFFFNDTETTEIYKGEDNLSLHDDLPILYGVEKKYFLKKRKKRERVSKQKRKKKRDGTKKEKEKKKGGKRGQRQRDGLRVKETEHEKKNRERGEIRQKKR